MSIMLLMPVLTIGDDLVDVLALHLLQQQVDLVALGLDADCKGMT